MLKLNKLISLSMVSILLSSNLYSLTFEVNNQNEYLKTFQKTFLSPDDHRIIINCNNCGISKKDVKYYNILDNVNKNSNITFVLNNISVTYNKEIFLNNMEHLFIKNDSINKIEVSEILDKNTNISKDNNYVLIDGEKVSLDVIKGLLKKKENKPIPYKDYEPNIKLKKELKDESIVEKVIFEKKIEPMKIEENVNKVENTKVVEQPKIETKENTIKNLFENTKVENNIDDEYNVYVIASYNSDKYANSFIKTKLSDYKTNVVKNGKVYRLELTLNNGTKEEQLSFVKSLAKDAYLKGSKNKINNEVKENYKVNNTKNVIGVYSSKSKEEVEKYLKKHFSDNENNIKQTNNGYYLGYIEFVNENDLKELKKISKDAWLIKNFKN